MEPTLAALPEKPRRFWDRENDWLFAGVVARTLDYFSMLNMRRRGRQEIFLRNEVVDNHAAFAAVEASATGVSIAAAYLFHRYGITSWSAGPRWHTSGWLRRARCEIIA
jgi:hypothetical protein